MATQKICDGCGWPDEEEAPVRTVSLTFTTNGNVADGGTWDMCGKCGVRQAALANPTTWERRKRRTKAAKS